MVDFMNICEQALDSFFGDKMIFSSLKISFHHLSENILQQGVMRHKTIIIITPSFVKYFNFIWLNHECPIYKAK